MPHYLKRCLFIGLPGRLSGGRICLPIQEKQIWPWVGSILSSLPSIVALGNAMDREAWQSTAHGVAKEPDNLVTKLEKAKTKFFSLLWYQPIPLHNCYKWKLLESKEIWCLKSYDLLLDVIQKWKTICNLLLTKFAYHCIKNVKPLCLKAPHPKPIQNQTGCQCPESNFTIKRNMKMIYMSSYKLLWWFLSRGNCKENSALKVSREK